MTKKNRSYIFYHVPKGLMGKKPAGCEVDKSKTIPGQGNLPNITVKTCKTPKNKKKK